MLMMEKKYEPDEKDDKYYYIYISSCRYSAQKRKWKGEKEEICELLLKM